MGDGAVRRRGALGMLVVAAVGLLGGGAPVAVAGVVAACQGTPSPTQPGYTVADPRCDFDGAAYTGGRFEPLTDPAGRPLSRVFTGVAGGAAFRLELPLAWTGDLVLWAHGYRGEGGTVWVDNPRLREYFVRAGFGWAASSYQRNGYQVGQGAADTHSLIAQVGALAARPRAVYLTGASMGGQVTAVAIEKYRDFAGAMPLCGVLGDVSLFDYFLDANLTAAGLTGAGIAFPPTVAAGVAYTPAYVDLVRAELPRLGTGFLTGNPADVTLTGPGRRWSAAVEQRSGGSRPGFDAAFRYWASVGWAALPQVPFLFGLYPGLVGGSTLAGATTGVAPGNVAGNLRTVYRLSGRSGPLRPAERAVNAAVLRVAPTAAPSADLTGIPRVAGDPRIPVLSLHGLGDLLVPFSMEQRYAERAARRHESGLFVSRAIRSVRHCDFTQAELQTGFADLVSWVRQHRRPAGDDVLDADAVAEPTFGCRFTDPTPAAHGEFQGAPCPPAGPR